MNLSRDRKDPPTSAFAAGKKRRAIKVEDVDLVAWKCGTKHATSVPSPNDNFAVEDLSKESSGRAAGISLHAYVA